MIRTSTVQCRSIRLQGYDYSQNGAYFVTICTQNRECLFGDVQDNSLCLNQIGERTAESWGWLEKNYNHVRLDEWVLMPNHLHGILLLVGSANGVALDHVAPSRNGSRLASTTETTTRKTLGRLVGAFKTVSTKRINQFRQTLGVQVWQRNYWERIIRDDGELNNIRQYIQTNPTRWKEDALFSP